jgi:anthranilate phosphoribosyltransferase
MTNGNPLKLQLEKLLDHRDLQEAEAGDVLRALTDPALSPAVAGALLAALRSKGVVAAELRGFAKAMRELARRPKLQAGLRSIDIVGTGGDGVVSGRLRLAGCEAWQSLHFQSLGQRRRARTARTQTAAR